MGTGGTPRLFAKLPAELRVWASHGDDVAAVPPGFSVAATSATAPIAAMEAPDRALYALLFHPEVVAHRPRRRDPPELCLRRLRLHGRLDDRVVHRGGDRADPAAGRAAAKWSAACRAASIRRWRRMLIHRAIGDRLTCIFVDNGLLRHDEANQIQKRFTEKLQLPLDFVDASDLFLERLAGVTDPETEAEDHRRHVHRRVRDSAPTSWAGSTSSARARSIRT